MSREFDLTNQVVLITGAGRGIGRGIAEVLAEAGADVAINALTPNHVERTAQAIASQTGRQVLPVLGDVTRSDGVDQVVSRVMEQFGRIDVLINNLGDAIGGSLVGLPDADQAGAVNDTSSISDAELQRIIDINLTGTLLCSRAVAPQMLARRAGKVINIASYTAGRSGGNLVLYTLAKTALVGFTRAQALEWAPYGINVNAIAPGLFPEPMALTGQREDRLAAWARKSIPLGRTGRLREVGHLALYLASAASAYMTGQTLYLDGGLSL
jgi:NAD(P)-dependent dehydrogenase (short-subunit alcohol dehydrogenase family)